MLYYCWAELCLRVTGCRTADPGASADPLVGCTMFWAVWWLGPGFEAAEVKGFLGQLTY